MSRPGQDHVTSSGTGKATGAGAGRQQTTGPHGATSPDNPKPGGRWLLLALAGLIILGLLIWALTQCGTSSQDQAAPPAAPTSNAPAPGAAADGGTGVPSAAAGTPGTLVAGTTSLFGVVADPGAALTSVVGQTATGTAVPVQSVPADEGFWVGTGETDRVWVQLLPADVVPGAESPVTVRPGQLIDLTGRVTAHGADFPAAEGIDTAEGADQLVRQGAHLEADQNQIKVVGNS
ncbi:hypothetical protein L6E12_05230 [Actinokineospora sp. PR83]|uniref:hypothetical protein n=1 Tax=Actinokineospora sp. PR83 TaxID=2884908 RepID=UPI001F295D79|nr:hypothetical protein [Actinokineospora sp. PR83]MCG8915192.1 hypothetical protein [Actinokineospora sp. PR83]